jgi:hypothetical protein
MDVSGVVLTSVVPEPVIVDSGVLVSMREEKAPVANAPVVNDPVVVTDAPPTPPAVVPVPTTNTGALLSLKEVTSDLTSDLTSDVSKLQSELVKIISEVITKMPQTKAEALEMYETLTMKLSTLLVSQLPGFEQKAATMALWALDALKDKAKGCFSFLSKK